MRFFGLPVRARQYFVWVLALLCLASASTLHAAEKVSLTESEDDERTFDVQTVLKVTGKLLASGGKDDDGKDKQIELPMTVDATLAYRERRVPGLGGDAQAFRTARDYSTADANIVVSEQKTNSRLPEARRLIVAAGSREGVTLYCPTGLLDYSESQLLRVPADSLAVLALLPDGPVESGDTWTPPQWAAQMLAGVEALDKADVTCKLESVKSGKAAITVNGTIAGANFGAWSKVTFQGKLEYDLSGKYISRVELEQKEESGIGTVSAGQNITAKVTVTRQPTTDVGKLNEQTLKRIPLDSDDRLLLLRYEAPFGIRVVHDRDWHLYHQTPKAVALRLVDRGSFIAQCSISSIVAAGPGNHTPVEKFESDIRGALGDRFKQIVKSETLDTGDDRFIHRVEASGQFRDEPMTWVFYLCASPEGQQVSFVFEFEPKFTARLAQRDIDMVRSIEFLPGRTGPSPGPTPAGK